MAGWGCEACLGYNPPGVDRCVTCGLRDPEQAAVIEAREKAAREEERRRIEALDGQAREALGRLKVGGTVRLCSELAAQDGFAELVRRVRADEQAAAARAAIEAAGLAARAEEAAAAEAAAAAAVAAADAVAAERGEGFDEALSELEALLGSASADAGERRAPSPVPALEPEPEPEPEPLEAENVVRRHPEKLWDSHKRWHCGQQAVVVATETADITVLLRFDDCWELCASLRPCRLTPPLLRTAG